MAELTMVSAAVTLARHGFYVFPCRAGGKVPATRTGFKAATRDPRRIEAWWARNPHLNIGIATGLSDLVVIDCDRGKCWPLAGPQPPGVNDGADVLVALAERHGAVGDGSWFYGTAQVVTPSGGLHLYYRVPRGCTIGSSAGRVGPWVDVRADGGYVVGPWSRTLAGHYRPVGWEWVAEADGSLDGDMVTVAGPPAMTRLSTVLPVLPSWLADLCAAPERPDPPADPLDRVAAALDRDQVVSTSRYAAAALQRECAAVAETIPGQRNHRLNRAAFALGQLVGAGLLDRGDVEAELLAAAELARLPRAEALATIASGMDAGVDSPREVM